jgi:hypothetical protein
VEGTPRASPEGFLDFVACREGQKRTLYQTGWPFGGELFDRKNFRPAAWADGDREVFFTASPQHWWRASTTVVMSCPKAIRRSATVAKQDAAVRGTIPLGIMPGGADTAARVDADSQDPNATSSATSFEHIRESGPGRLNEALNYAVGRIEPDARAVAAIMDHLGWGGGGLSLENAPERTPAGSEENVAHLANRAIERLRAASFVPEAVQRAIDLTEQSLPILEAELCDLLLNARLCFVRFSCDALAAAATAFRATPPFERVRLGDRDGLVKSGAARQLNQLSATAKRLMRMRGCANIIELTDRARGIFGPNTSQGFTEAVIRTGEPFEWLDQKSGWFWQITTAGSDSNQLVNQIRRVMAVAPRITLRELRAAIRRDYPLGGFAPPLRVLAAVCKRLYYIRMEGDVVIRIDSLQRWNQVLGPDEANLVRILQASPPVLSRAALLAHCREGGMNEDTINQFLACSAILRTPGPDHYGLVSAVLPDGTGHEPASDLGQPDMANVMHGFLPKGRVLLAWKVDEPALWSGVVRVPDAVSNLVEGDYRIKSITGSELGVFQITQLACWDVRPLLRNAAGEIDDTLVVVLDPLGRDAIGIIADWPTVYRLRSGALDLFAINDGDREIGRSKPDVEESPEGDSG